MRIDLNPSTTAATGPQQRFGGGDSGRIRHDASQARQVPPMWRTYRPEAMPYSN